MHVDVFGSRGVSRGRGGGPWWVRVDMLKGFYFSGIVFVAVFLVILHAAFLFSDAQRDSTVLLVREAQGARLFADVEGDLLRFSTTAYEVLYNNSVESNGTENNRTAMQQRISAVIRNKWNASVAVFISNASNSNSRVTLVFLNYSLNDVNVTVNASGFNHSFLVGNAFFHFSRIFETFNASEMCAYADFEPESVNFCTVNYTGFTAAKRSATGFTWDVAITAGDCGEQWVNYTVSLYDSRDLATLVYPFQLASRGGGFGHRASC